MKKQVEIWSMSSDDGYVPSYGDQDAFVVPLKDIPEHPDLDLVQLVTDNEYQAIDVAVLENRVPIKRRNGACTYQGHIGDIEVPMGSAVIVVVDTYVCTRDNNVPCAWIVQ